MKLIQKVFALLSLLILFYSCKNAQNLNTSALYEDDEVYYQPGETFITDVPSVNSTTSTSSSSNAPEDDYYSGNTDDGTVINNYYGDVNQFGNQSGLNNSPGRFMYDPIWGWRYNYWQPNNGWGGWNIGFGYGNNWGWNNGWGWNDPWMNPYSSWNNGWGWNDPWMMSPYNTFNNGWAWNNGLNNGWNNGWNYGWGWNPGWDNGNQAGVVFGNRGGQGGGYNNNSSGMQEFQILNPRKQPGRPSPTNAGGQPTQDNDDFYSVPSRSAGGKDQTRPTTDPRPEVEPRRPSRSDDNISRPAPSRPAPSRPSVTPSSPSRGGGGSSPSPSRGGGGGTRRR